MMSWCTGFEIGSLGRVALLQDEAGAVVPATLEQLVKEGVPRQGHQARFAYEGDFSTWEVANSAEYIHGLGLPNSTAETPHRHQVFSAPGPKGLKLYVPTLALLRALLKPTRPVFAATFGPTSIDLLSFVDYSVVPPRVVIDNRKLAALTKQLHRTASDDRPVVWMQTSRSARSMAQSLHVNARAGWLRMSLPKGRVRLNIQATVIGSKAYVSVANVSMVVVPAEDSITGTAETFAFRANALANRKTVGSEFRRAVPLRSCGNATLTDAEWNDVEPVLLRRASTQTKHSHRDRLDRILTHLASGEQWTALQTKKLSAQTLAAALRRWSTDGRLGTIVDKLIELRGDAPPTGAERA